MTSGQLKQVLSFHSTLQTQGQTGLKFGYELLSETQIAKLNKVQRIEEYIVTLENYVVSANAKATEIDSMTDAEVADACELVTNNWSNQDDNYLVTRFGTEEAYNVWLNECNEDMMKRYRAQSVTFKNRAERLKESIKKENVKLAKAQAQA